MPFRFESLFFDGGAPAEGRVVDFFIPPAPTAPVSFFFVHGGGWRGGARAIFHGIMKTLVDRGCACASTDYRLQGVHLGEQVSDVREAYSLFARELASRGIVPRIVIHGSSAGAHLAAMVALTGTENDAGSPLSEGKPVALSMANGPATFEPWPDIFPGIWASMQDIIGSPWAQRPDLYREASPVHRVGPDSPPILFMHAENEHMFPLEQTRRMQRELERAGGRMELIQYPAMEHGFFYSLERPQQRKALDDLVRFAESIPR